LKFQQLTDLLFCFAIIEFKELLIWGVDFLCYNALQFGVALSVHEHFEETFSMSRVLFGQYEIWQ
jgi:hypothetical protein